MRFFFLLQSKSIAQMIQRRAPLLLYNNTIAGEGNVNTTGALKLLSTIIVLEVDAIVTSLTFNKQEKVRKPSATKYVRDLCNSYLSFRLYRRA